MCFCYVRIHSLLFTLNLTYDATGSSSWSVERTEFEAAQRAAAAAAAISVAPAASAAAASDDCKLEVV